MKALIVTLFFLAASTLAAFPATQEGRGPDGHYHDPVTGEAQPDMCDNSFKNEKPCDCNRTTECEGTTQKTHPNPRCKTYCRTNDCHCIGGCS